MALFPFETVLSKLPPLSSKMAADVNPCFQSPTQLACQVLPKQIYNRAVHSWIAGGFILFVRHKNWSPALLNRVLVLLMGESCLPQCRWRDFPSDDLSGGCGVSCLEFSVVMRRLLLTHCCAVKGRNKKISPQ